jgi:hypothetical protein
MFDTFNLMGTDQITMNIEVEEGNVDVGNTAEPSYEVVASSGCSAQLSTNDTDEHELGKCYYQLKKVKVCNNKYLFDT